MIPIKGVREYCINQSETIFDRVSDFQHDDGHEEASGTKYVPPRTYSKNGKRKTLLKTTNSSW